MSESAATQEQTPVTALHQSGVSLTVAPSARKSISADSFRKLTALLKKPVAIPDTLPVAAVEPAPIPMEIIPEPVVQVAPILVEPEIIPQPVLEAVPQPVIETPTEPIIETLAAPVKKIERPRPRDAFALPPSALTKLKLTAPIEPVSQTPQQGQESAELARSLLDMMASGASSGQPQERALAADTLLRMLPRLPLKSLIMLAERLCMMEAPPQLLVSKLICDSRIEVAGPLLEECMHITDEDLAQVIHDGIPAKNRMIGRRRRISRAVSAQLIRTHDSSVLLTLARNVNAEIPHESFAEMVSLAEEHPEILAPLCTRPDLPVPFAFELFWPAPAQLRRYLLSRFLTDSETLTKILKITLETASDEAASNKFPQPDQIRSALQLAAEGNHDEAAATLATLAKIETGTASRILADGQGDALAALLKAVRIPRQVAADVIQELLTTSSGLIDPTRDPDELQSLFDSLSFNKARILITYWDWATTQTGPYAALN